MVDPQIESVNEPYTHEATLDEYIGEWVSYDLNEIPHWSQIRVEAEQKALDANRVILDHKEKCPSDWDLIEFGYRDWKNDPVNFKCNGLS